MKSPKTDWCLENGGMVGEYGFYYIVIMDHSFIPYQPVI